jgi:hypothetical protein
MHSAESEGSFKDGGGKIGAQSYLTLEMSTLIPDSSLTSLTTAISNVSPISRKPANKEYRPGFHLP